jgi:hypothetical protein
VSNKELLLKAWIIAEQKSKDEPDNVWAQIYMEWFSSGIQKDKAGLPVPSFTLAAAQGLLLDEKEK